MFGGGIMRKNAGFTLLELLAVLSIIALIAGFLFPTITKVKENAREARAKAVIETIGMALQAYRIDWGFFGPDETELNSSGKLYSMLMTNKKNGPYMEFRQNDLVVSGAVSKVLDPWGGFYEVHVDTDAGSNNVPAHNKHSFDISCVSQKGKVINNWE